MIEPESYYQLKAESLTGAVGALGFWLDRTRDEPLSRLVLSTVGTPSAENS
jgi:hypothetical protein